MRWTIRRAEDEVPAPTDAGDQVAQPPSHPLVHVVDDIPELEAGARPVLVHALDGFLSAGSAPRLAATHLGGTGGRVVASFDIDRLYDYRARRPGLVFDQDHYSGYEGPRLTVRLLEDRAGVPYLLLAGPEPDFGWEFFAAAVRTMVERFQVELTVGMGAVPMGVPHTRPTMITAHATRHDLIDRPNVWKGQLMVPASAQSMLELRLGQWGHDAMGYVAHVPHYLAGVEFPAAAVALVEAVASRTGLDIDVEPLRAAAAGAVVEIDKQIVEQEGQEVLTTLEQQYDSFTRGAGDSLAEEGPLPSADELGRQVEQFLAGLDRRDDRD